MKKILTILAVTLIAATAFANALEFHIKKSVWDALSTGDKNSGKAILKKFTGADVQEALGWTWGMREIANTNEIWGYAVYSGNAMQLDRGTEQKTEAKFDLVDTKWGSTHSWTTNFWLKMASEGFEKIPVDIP